MSEDQFQRLLSLQDHDTRIEQLRHRRDTLAERAVLAACQDACRQLGNQQDAKQAEFRELQRKLKRNEDELVSLEDRVKRENDRLYSGEITGTRELLTLQEEIDGLRSRCSEIEGVALGLMETMDGLEAELGALAGELSAAKAGIVEAQRKLAEAEAAVQRDLDQEAAARSAEAGEIASDALAGYERLQSVMGGVAVARLRNGACEGCHLALSAMELDRLRHAPADEVCYCEECGRILVRT